MAVDFFLVLSGFILSHSYLYNKNKTHSPREFICHRIARLYPLHILTLLTFILAATFVNDEFPMQNGDSFFIFMQHLTLTQNIGLNHQGATFNYPSWSISVKFWINIAFILFISRATKNATLFAIALGGLLLLYGKIGHLDANAGNYFDFINSGIVRGLSSFFLGILSYRAYLYYQFDIRIKKHCTYLEILCLAALIVVIFVRPKQI